MPDYSITYLRRPNKITQKQLKEIDNRRLYALKMNDYADIQDAKEKVIKIIDDDGLSSEEQKTRLDTALKILEYIIPKKKSTELTISTRKLEDIISESIEEAQIIDTKADKTDDKIAEQSASNKENA
jgi:hypothetical protein